MTGSAPAGYRMERGFLWPADDRDCAAVVFNMAADLDEVYPLCRSFNVAVQAGGNCGVWPKALGWKFDLVYTFEPDPVNFRCLAANASEENIIKFNAALGARPALVGLNRKANNCGAHSIGGEGSIPVLRIDDLGLQTCDLICLDIEGYELPALEGAEQTIRRCSPVIMAEDKGLSKQYGIDRGAIETMLAKFGYRVVARPHRDVVLVKS